MISSVCMKKKIVSSIFLILGVLLVGGVIVSTVARQDGQGGFFQKDIDFRVPYFRCSLTHSEEKEGYMFQKFGDEGGGGRFVFSLDGMLLDVESFCDAMPFGVGCSHEKATSIGLKNCVEIDQSVFIEHVPHADEQLGQFWRTGVIPE